MWRGLSRERRLRITRVDVRQDGCYLMPAVSVILLTKNAGDGFGLLLERLYSQDLDADFEVIIIDSGSTDTTVALARKSQAVVREIKPEDFGHAKVRNLGASIASGEHLAFLSQDALPCHSDWLSNLVSPLRNGSADIVYGRQIAYPRAKPMDKFFYWHFYPEVRVTVKPEKADNPGDFYLEYVFVSDVNAAMKRRTWEEASFDEGVLFAEDKDFAVKAVARGRTVVYEPDAAVYHSHFYSLRSLMRRRFHDGKSFARTASLWRKTSERRPSFIKQGLEYWSEELRFLWDRGHARWVPYAFVYDLAFFGAFKVGQVAFAISSKGKRRAG